MRFHIAFEGCTYPVMESGMSVLVLRLKFWSPQLASLSFSATAAITSPRDHEQHHIKVRSPTLTHLLTLKGNTWSSRARPAAFSTNNKSELVCSGAREGQVSYNASAPRLPWWLCGIQTLGGFADFGKHFWDVFDGGFVVRVSDVVEFFDQRDSVRA